MDGLTDGETLADADIVGLTLADGLALAEGLRLALADKEMLGLTDGDLLADGLTLADGDIEGLTEALSTAPPGS